MKIQSIEFKNFASYGNSPQIIELNKDISEMYLVLGKNGHGKTTIANAIIFALYGKLDGVKLADLPNRINKTLHVKIKLLCGKKEVEIERGLAPNVFLVKINGKEWDKAGKRSVQEYLEEEIYGIPYHVFKNIIILSINDFKSFLTMSNHDKKQIFDRMFGFSILNEMQTTLKEERKTLKIEIESYLSQLGQIEENIESVKKKLNELKNNSNVENKNKIKELTEWLKTNVENKNKLEKVKEKISKEQQELTKETQGYVQQKSNLKAEIEQLKRKLKLYENNQCPTCESALDSSFHTERKKELVATLKDYPDKIKEVQTAIDNCQAQKLKIEDKNKQLNSKAIDLNVKIQRFKEELIQIKNSNTGDFSHLESIIEDFNTQETEKRGHLDTLNASANFLEMVDSVLGEDGVKNLAISTILPNINTNIAVLVNEMHLNFSIQFDKKFNCIIKQLGEEISPMTLSTGERKKADFIVIVSIIKVLKLRFPQLNLLFLDELLSSVDSDGIHDILKILSKTIKEIGINVFIINHTVLPHELFDKRVNIYRENGFSRVSIENIE